MALQKTTTNASGLTATDAYHRVENVTLASKTEITFSVRSYASTDRPFFAEEFYSCAYNLSGSNPIEQAYVYLKTLSEFSGATDV